MLISLAGYLESVRCENVVEVVLETLLKVWHLKSYIGVKYKDPGKLLLHQ